MTADAARISLCCGNCGKVYALKLEMAGRTAKCSCGVRLKVPAAPLPPLAGAPARTPSPAVTAEDLAMQALEEPSSPRIEDEATHLSAEMFDGVPLDESLFDEVARDPQFEVEAPPERAVTEAVRRAVFEGKVAAARAKEKQVDLGRFPGWQLRFVGLYGIVIMIGAALMGLSNTVVIIMAALDKRVGLEHGLGLLALAAFQAVVYFVLFRMGRGLVESQRSAVKGLIVLYVVFVAGGVIGHLADRESTVIIAIYVGLISVLLLPPILVAYTSWSDFHETND